MPLTEDAIEAKIDSVLTKYQNLAPIQYYPYATGSTDIYKQRTKTFGTPVTVIGRAINRPTKEMVTVIGDGEVFDMAFLFSRLELVRKFPAATEGEWMDTYGQMGWNSRRFKIEAARPTAQVATKYLMMVILATTIEGQRNP